MGRFWVRIAALLLVPSLLVDPISVWGISKQPLQLARFSPTVYSTEALNLLAWFFPHDDRLNHNVSVQAMQRAEAAAKGAGASVDSSAIRSETEPWHELLLMISARTGIPVESSKAIEDVLSRKLPWIEKLGRQSLLSAQASSPDGFIDFIEIMKKHPDAFDALIRSLGLDAVQAGLSKDPAGVARTVNALTPNKLQADLGTLAQPQLFRDALRTAFQEDPAPFAEFIHTASLGMPTVMTLIDQLGLEGIRDSVAHQMPGVTRAIDDLSTRFHSKYGGSRHEQRSRNVDLEASLNTHVWGPANRRLGRQVFREAWRIDPVATAEIIVRLSDSNFDVSTKKFRSESEVFYRVLGPALRMSRLRKAMARDPHEFQQALGRLLKDADSFAYLARPDVLGASVLQRSFDSSMTGLGWLVQTVGRNRVVFSTYENPETIGLDTLREMAADSPEMLAELLLVLATERGRAVLERHTKSAAKWAGVRSMLATNPRSLMAEIKQKNTPDELTWEETRALWNQRPVKMIQSLWRLKLHTGKRWVLRGLLRYGLFASLYDQVDLVVQRYTMEENPRALKRATGQIIEDWVRRHPFRLRVVLPWILKYPGEDQLYQRNVLVGGSEVSLYAHVWAPRQLRSRERPKYYFDLLTASVPLQPGLHVWEYAAPRGFRRGVQGDVVFLTPGSDVVLEPGVVKWRAAKDLDIYDPINSTDEPITVLKVVFHRHPQVTTFVPVEENSSQFFQRSGVDDDPTRPLHVQLLKDARQIDTLTFYDDLHDAVGPFPEIYTMQDTALIDRAKAIAYVEIHHPRVYLTREGSYLLDATPVEPDKNADTHWRGLFRRILTSA